MKDLIRGSINWDALGGQKSEYRFELGKAVIHKDTGVLDMPVRCLLYTSPSPRDCS